MMSGCTFTRATATRALGAALLGATTLLAVGCFPIEDIDRTQPNKVQKIVFNDGGEWFFRQTVIDFPAAHDLGFTFIGEQSDTERVVWDIQEKYLFAYRAYPFQEGGDGHARPGTGPYMDSPVAAFAITSHFDVQRQYNPATGEQTNVLEENGSDRPWYERQWMRIDWSNNLIADFRFGAGSVSQQPVAFFNGEDPTHETKDQAIITQNYVDVVHNVTAMPEVNELYTQYFGYEILECWLYSSIHQDCVGADLKIRSSFMRAPDQSSYVPQAYDDIRFQKFGYFRADRYGYNPEYGVVEPAQQQLAARWNLWDGAGDCFDAEAEKPYANCSPDQLKTIVYYLNEDFPSEQKSWAVDNGDEWNRVFREGVLASTGWTADQLGGRRLFTVCPNNPVEAGDPSECGDAGLNPQIGDLRYSMYYYVPNAQNVSPLGYGPSAQDPLTGETIAANAFYYGAAGMWIAARTRDIIELELGIIEMDDITGGVPVRDAVQRLRTREDTRFKRLVENFDKDHINQQVEDLRIRENAQRLNHQINTGEAFIDMRPGRLEKLQYTDVDERLVTPELKDILRGLGVSQSADGLQDFQGLHDMSKLLSPDLFSLSEYRASRLLSPEAGGCILRAEEVLDTGLTGLISTVRREFYDTSVSPPVLKNGKTRDDVYTYLVGRTMSDTQLHEIGHTVGLRHNFAGSTDALNFGPEYWRLRGPGYTMGGSDTRPRPMWMLSGPFLEGWEQALREGVQDLQDSSVMDYASTYGTNVTLGMYDAAAIKYAYFDVVEVFNSPDIDEDRAKLLRAGEVHYTYFPEVVSNAPTYEERVASMYDRRAVNWRLTDRRSEQFDPSLTEVPYIFCSDEYRDASAICATWDMGMDNFERTWKKAEDYRRYHIFDAFKRERVGFGVDVFGYISRTYSRSFTYILNQYKNWVNDELIIRRDRPCVWYEDGQRQEVADRFVAEACGLPGYLGALEGLNLFSEIIQIPDIGCYARLENGCYYAAPGNDDGVDGSPVELVSSDPAACDALPPIAETDDADALVPLKVTAQTAYTHLPDSTTCARNDLGELTFEVLDSVTGNLVSKPAVELPYGPSRFANTLYDREQYGYYFYWKPTVMGSWWDKWLAIKAIGDPNTDFIGVDASSDTRSFLISMNTLFGQEINDLIGGIITDEPAVYGPSINADGTDVEFIELLPVSGGIDRETSTRAFLDPDQQYTFRLLAMFNSAYQSQITDDLEFSESINVGRSYNNTEVDLPALIKDDPTRYAEFRDPETGFIYYAVRQARTLNSGEDIYSVGYEYVRKIKDQFFVGGADGPGLEPLEGFMGWQLQGEIRILEIMKETRNVFGRSDVWEGDF